MGHLASLVGWADCKLRTPTCQVSHWCLCEAPAKQAMPAGLEGCQGCSSLADFVANGRPSERKALQASLSSAQKCGRQFQTLALVLGIEGLNTALEKLCDYVQPEFDPKIGFIKDISAGAVMLVAIAAGIVGLIIYIPKIF